MRIVIDMQGAQTASRFRGIGRYAMSFAKAVVRNRGEHEIILALSGLFPDSIEPIRAAFEGILPQESIRVWHAPGPVAESQPGNDTRREIAELIREAFLASLQPDVIHVTSLFEGYVDDAVTSIGKFDNNTPVSVTLYDLIPLLNPDQYLKPNPSYEQYYHSKIDHLSEASQLLAISEFARREGVSHLCVEKDRVVNVSTAVESKFCSLDITEKATEELRKKCKITRRYVLCTGGADERKNLPRLIQAYAALPHELRQNRQLLLAGKMPEGDIKKFERIAEQVSLDGGELCFTGYITDDELVQLYNLCELYVFPSWHEGFGLPVLEAMACGAPVIGGNTSSLPEVIGLDAALFDPLDVESITNKMRQALADAEFRERLREHGAQRAKQFSWDETAKGAIATWENLYDKSEYPSRQNRSHHKPRLAFVSPLPPERTGIANYSAELLPALAQHYQIELVVGQDRFDDPWISSHFKIRSVDWLKANISDIDRALYQLGNSPNHQHMLSLLRDIPGTVVLHDFYLSGLKSWLELHVSADTEWTKALYEAHGYKAVQERYRDADAAKRKYPVNLDVLQYAQGIIVHSNYSRELAKQWYESGLAGRWRVIPQLRTPTASVEKLQARNHLGLKKNDFLVCSFGFLDSSKLNHRLLECWLASSLAKDQNCHLVFVGENHGGDYGNALLECIRKSGLNKRIRISGFVSPEVFRQHLIAADLAVQLRTKSRGETSRTVLDCMSHALPVIVNANGSMAELDNKAVWLLPDEFDDADLIEALATLRQNPDKRRQLSDRARQVILDQHSPEKCAAQYAEAIELFHRSSERSTAALLQSIVKHGEKLSNDAEFRQLASCIATSLPLARPAKRLFVDITATCHNDLKTGIERVARALVVALLESPPAGFRIEPVYLDQVDGRWVYCRAAGYTLRLLECPEEALEDDIVEPECGDIVLAVDFSGEMLIQAQQVGLFASYQSRGVSVCAIVFDLLPIRMPEVFPPGADQIHAKWLRSISEFDGAICISKAVADDLAQWQIQSRYQWDDRRPFQIGWFHLGGDVINTVPTRGLPENAKSILTQLRQRNTFLMVGTIEPRKSYLQTIEAFTKLWAAGADINLVIVGKEGWQDLPEDMRRDIPQTIERVRSHPELNKHLFWLEGISDEYLEAVYEASTCLIAVSYGEGFGLPLIEAAQHKLPIIARDISVFREVAGEHAHYFSAQTPNELAQAITTWLGLYAENQQPKSDLMPWLTWKESVEMLVNVLNVNRR